MGLGGEGMQLIVQKIVDTIEANLESISLDDLAQSLNYSIFYLQRLFALETGIGLKTYIRLRRLSRAAFELKESEQRVIDIALKYGYETPESFTKSYKQQHNQAPSRTRLDNQPLHIYPMYRHEPSRKRENMMKVRIETREAFVICGTKYEMSIENNENLKVIPGLWDELNESGLDQVLFEMNDGSINGIVGVCVPKDESKMEYWIGTVTQNEMSGYDVLHVPAARFAVFEAKGPLPEAIQTAWQEIMNDWIPTSGYQIDGEFDFEMYPNEDPSSETHTAEIWIKLK